MDERAGTWQSCNQEVYNDFLGKPRFPCLLFSSLHSPACLKTPLLTLQQTFPSKKVHCVVGFLLKGVNSAADIMRNYDDKVSKLLDAGIEVLIYVGVGKKTITAQSQSSIASIDMTVSGHFDARLCMPSFVSAKGRNRVAAEDWICNWRGNQGKPAQLVHLWSFHASKLTSHTDAAAAAVEDTWPLKDSMCLQLG